MQDLLALAWGIYFPDQGSNPGPFHWELRVFATGPPEKFSWCLLKSGYDQPLGGLRVIFLSSLLLLEKNYCKFNGLKHMTDVILHTWSHLEAQWIRWPVPDPTIDDLRPLFKSKSFRGSWVKYPSPWRGREARVLETPHVKGIPISHAASLPLRMKLSTPDLQLNVLWPLSLCLWEKVYSLPVSLKYDLWIIY